MIEDIVTEAMNRTLETAAKICDARAEVSRSFLARLVGAKGYDRATALALAESIRSFKTPEQPQEPEP